VDEDGLRLKLGGLEITLDAYGLGTCRVSGESLSLAGLTVTVVPGGPLRLNLDLLPPDPHSFTEILRRDRGRNG
jgi:hypothetical protein